MTPSRKREDLWKLHAELECTSDDRAVCEVDGQLNLTVVLVKEHQRRDHREVPQHRRGIRHEESAVAVENSQAPRRENEQARAGKENAREPHCELALFSGEPVGNDCNKPWRSGNAEQHDDCGYECQHAGDGACEPRRFFFVALPQQ